MPLPQGDVRRGVSRGVVANEKVHGRQEERNEGVQEGSGNLGRIKLKIPPFHGRNDPDIYLEWEKKVELVFNCHEFPERKKLKFAVTEFVDYAIVWWNQLVTNWRRHYEPLKH